MIVELLIIFAAWVALGAFIKTIFGIPLYLAVPIAFLLLIIYDIIIPHEGTGEKLTTNNLFPALRNLSLCLFVLGVDSALFIVSVWLEAGGARLVLPNTKWFKEILSILEVLGLKEYLGNISPTTLYGVMSTLFFMLFNYIAISVFYGILMSIQRGLVNKSQSRDRKGILQEFYSLIIPLTAGIATAFINYGILLPYMAKIAQLQIAKFVWSSDFQVLYRGEEIQVIQQSAPDLSIILQKHEGEFMKIIVTKFPYVLLTLHLGAAFLTEYFFLHTQMNFGHIERRHAEVIHMIRERLEELFRRGITAGSGITRQFRRSQSTQPPVMHNEDSRQVDLNPAPVIEPRSDGGNGGQPEGSSSPETDNLEDTPPEDQPVRVIGGGETITPRTAWEHPGLYVVEEKRNPETQEVSYQIYTREFHETLHNKKEERK